MPEARTDDELTQAWLAGDPAAFAVLYDSHAPRLLGFLKALGAGHDSAEDLAQATWLKALDALPRYRARGRLRQWLFTIAHRQWLDHVRSAWHVRRQDGAAPADALDRADPARGPAEAAATSEEQDRLMAAVHALPEVQRRTVLLRIDGELTFREIAEAMGCPLGTVLWRMKDAERRLAKALGTADRA